jgi:hypothetical protein
LPDYNVRQQELHKFFGGSEEFVFEPNDLEMECFLEMTDGFVCARTPVLFCLFATSVCFCTVLFQNRFSGQDLKTALNNISADYKRQYQDAQWWHRNERAKYEPLILPAEVTQPCTGCTLKDSVTNAFVMCNACGCVNASLTEFLGKDGPGKTALEMSCQVLPGMIIDALEKTKPTVRPETIPQYDEWTEAYGTSGQGK